MDLLTRMTKQKRKMETRVTNDNKDSIINQLNKIAKTYNLPKVSKDTSVKEINRFKNDYVERLTYSIVTQAIKEGKDIIAEIESRDLKKSNDMETKRLGDFGKDLARVKKEMDRHLTKEEKVFIEKGNGNVKGYGNDNIMKLFQKTKTRKQAQDLINELKGKDPKKDFYDKQIEVFERSFQKVEIVREKDLEKLKNKIKSMDMQQALNTTNEMLRVIAIFDYKKFSESNTDETEIANARLDDMLIKIGLKNTGSKKVQKVIEKYKGTYK